ncbi:serine protease inhibitor 77Ba-like [Ostrinia nubilalis]|uniref:serine protease inhibitor 77Ba-like n=1 Tax=Ostrinia nubilalis TaxID=29057 RepID=UPI003082366B
MWKVVSVVCAVFASACAAPAEIQSFAPINEFALQLLENTYAYQDNFGNKNIAISPLSIWSIFSLLAEGSSGETFLELMKGLKLPRDLRTTQALHRAVNNQLKSNKEDVTLIGQSAMFPDCSLEVLPEFCEAATSYNTDIYVVDPSNTTKLAHDINLYVCLATDGLIANAVTPELLTDLRMVLVDALYFKASWTYQFDPSRTKESSFFNLQGKNIGSVNMMYQKAPHNIAYPEQIEAQVLEMTYGKNGQYSMMILLPFNGVPTNKVLKNLATKPMDWIAELRETGSGTDVDCFIPRFKLSTRQDMITPLQYSGIVSIFDSKKSQLPGVADSPLYVTKTIQNVEIEVTEEGTTAAASTVVGLENRILAQRFEANREFIFLIMERSSNVILFAGVYGEPSLD